jgi:antitoxin (DNA-binding transcriptional repressor) of toxin-antitoxin stability system
MKGMRACYALLRFAAVADASSAAEAPQPRRGGAAGGETFTVTVRGRPVARVVPLEEPPGPRVDVDRETLLPILAMPVDPRFAADVGALAAVLLPEDDPWPK